MKKVIKKVYGPYVVKQKSSKIYGRKIVQVHYIDGTKKNLLYSRHLMQEHLGRELNRQEEVDHIDQDKTNDVLDNLQIIFNKQHLKLDTKRIKDVQIKCIWCRKIVFKNPRNMDHNSKLGKAGPFCGRSCAGKYGAAIQNKQCEKLPVQPNGYIREYYTNKD